MSILPHVNKTLAGWLLAAPGPSAGRGRDLCLCPSELDRLMADLPGTDLSRLPQRRVPEPVQVPAGGSALAWRAAWRFWLAIGFVAFVIWLLGGASGGPWFLWVAVPLGLLMLRRWIAGGTRGQV
jgi:hypothetical protein